MQRNLLQAVPLVLVQDRLDLGVRFLLLLLKLLAHLFGASGALLFRVVFRRRLESEVPHLVAACFHQFVDLRLLLGSDPDFFLGAGVVELEAGAAAESSSAESTTAGPSEETAATSAAESASASASAAVTPSAIVTAVAVLAVALAILASWLGRNGGRKGDSQQKEGGRRKKRSRGVQRALPHGVGSWPKEAGINTWRNCNEFADLILGKISRRPAEID
jgi:hypothetical protein